MTLKGSRSAQKGSNPANTFDSIFPATSQIVNFSTSSVASTNAFQSNVTVVRLYASQDCYVKFGAAPVATSADMFLPGGITEYFGVAPGYKVAALTAGTDGILYVTEGDT